MKVWNYLKPRLLIGFIIWTMIFSLTPMGLEFNQGVVRNFKALTIGNGETLVLRIGYGGDKALAAGTLDYTYNGVPAYDTAQIVALLAVLASHGGGEMDTFTANVTVNAAITVPPNVTIKGVGTSSYFARDGINPIFVASTNNTFIGLVTDANAGITLFANTVLENVTIGATKIAHRDNNGSFSGLSANITTANFTTLNAPTGRGATYIVAGNDASTTVKAQADGLADGTADDVQINAGIAALPAGRTSYATVKLIGSFSTTNTITLASYTILDLTEAKITAGANIDVVTIPVTAPYTEIVGGLIDGNKGAGYTKYGISWTGTAVSETTQNSTVRGTEVQNCGDFGISGLRVTYVWIDGVKVHDCTNRGIFFNGGGYVWIKDSQTYRNGTAGAGYGTYFGSNLGAGKTWHDINIDGLQTYDNSGGGLLLTDNDNTLSPTRFTISRITATNNTATNILLQYVNSGLVSDIETSLSGNFGIDYESTSNITSTNIHAFNNVATDVLVGKNGTILSTHLVFNGVVAHGNGVASGDGLTISNTTYSTFANINSYNHTTADYGINEFGGGDYNTYIGNNLNNNTVNFNHSGTHDIVTNNIGYVTENSGASVGTGAQQTIAHGLGFTPTKNQIAIVADNSTGTAYQSANPDATNIYVTEIANSAWHWGTIGR